jgi:DNA-directed RNA polymerase subunit RPC12/RpoP
MQKRKCSDCGGELVLAVRGSQPQSMSMNDGPSLVTSAFTSWRCGTCGSAFTAAQLREDKRERSKTEHT